MTPVTTTVASQTLIMVNGTGEFGHTVTDATSIGSSTVLVSGWAQLAVCILIVVLCCCCTLLCLCTSCICCTSSPEEVQNQTVVSPTAIICDKPPSYDEVQRTSRYGLPSYQEAVRRESEISWIRIPPVHRSPLWSPSTPLTPVETGMPSTCVPSANLP